MLAACGDDGDNGDGDDASAQEARLRGREINVAAGVSVYSAAPSLEHFATDASPFTGGRIFRDASLFNTPIPPAAPLYPDSEDLVAVLLDRAAEGLVIATTEWTIPAFRAGATTPRVDVRLTADWAPFRVLRQVPIPDGAIPDPQDDGHLTIIDFDGGWVYDLWQAQRTDDGWEASWGNRIALDSDGIYPLGLSARGSGFSSLMGLIWPHEFAQGSINHVLVFSTLPNRAGLLVPPATESDGRSDDPLTLPEGARLRLDPALDLDLLDLAPWERVIARAMQEYGIILADNGSESISLYAVHPASFGGYAAPYDLEEGIGYATNIPLDRLQLLDWDELIDIEDLPNEVIDATIYAEPADVD